MNYVGKPGQILHSKLGWIDAPTEKTPEQYEALIQKQEEYIDWLSSSIDYDCRTVENIKKGRTLRAEIEELKK